MLRHGFQKDKTMSHRSLKTRQAMAQPNASAKPALTPRRHSGKAKPPQQHVDYVLVWLLFILCLVGLIAILSASAHVAQAQIGDASFYFKKQLIGIGFGCAGLLIALRIDVYQLPYWIKPLMIITLILLVCTHIPGLGLTIKGASRWLNLPGIRLQPSELAKPVIIIYLACILGQAKFNLLSFKDKAMAFVPVAAMMALILKQPDLGATMVLGAIIIVMYFTAGTAYWKILGVLGTGFIAFALLSWSTPYQQARITSWLDPWSDPQGTGFHLIQSMIAIGSGGLIGSGFGQSVQKLFYLPEQHTDFIFAVMAEEFGFVGVCVLLGLFVWLTQRGVTIACKSPTPYLKLLAMGLACMISIQAFVNLAVVTGSIPTTGLTLPFISYGSSSVAVNIAAMGLLLNISRYQPFKSVPPAKRKRKHL